jgi:hypothetical protein
MSRFDVIRDICPTIEKIVRDTTSREGFETVRISTDTPTRDNLRNLPVISMFICGIRFAPGYRERTDRIVTSTDATGKKIEYYEDAPAILHARLAISAHARTPPEEHTLLGLCIKSMLEKPFISGRDLIGDSFLENDHLEVFPDLETDFSECLSLWKTLGRDMKPTLFYLVRFRIESERRSKDLRRVSARDLSIVPNR